MMGLRLSEGIDRHRYIALGGQALDAHALDYLANIGMIEQIPAPGFHNETGPHGAQLRSLKNCWWCRK